MAGPNISFTGRIGDEEVARILERCRALIVTAVEEFGIVGIFCLTHLFSKNYHCI